MCRAVIRTPGHTASMRSWTLRGVALLLAAGLATTDPSRASAADGPCGAGTLPAEAATLATPLCGDDVSLSPDELRCQEAIARESAKYFEARRVEIEQRQRATAHARALDSVVPACAGIKNRRVGETAVPAVGAPCHEAGGLAGDPFDAKNAARCVRAALSGIANAKAPEPLPPNFVVVVTDDQRWDTTPYMPRLTEEIARNGLRFENAFVNTPVCAPSRATLLSGRYAAKNGVRSNSDAASSFDETESIAPALSKAGYSTGLFGIYLAGLGEEIPPGWDRWYGLENAATDEEGFMLFTFRDGAQREEVSRMRHDEMTDRLRDKASSFLAENSERPFFVWVGTTAPHTPAIPAERHAEAFADLEPYRPPSFREEDATDKPSWVQFFKAVTKPEGAARIDEVRRSQLRSLLGVDDLVGALSDRLEDLGLTDDTVFIFTSDNGHFWGEHWLSAKFAHYEEGIRVPLVMRFPRRSPKGRDVAGLALNADLAETVADLAGIERDDEGPGQSLAPSFAGTAIEREEIFLETPGGLIARPSQAVRTKRWKYIETDADGGIVQELYDLTTDPYELENLAAVPEHRGTRERLARHLEKQRTTIGTPPPDEKTESGAP